MFQVAVPAWVAIPLMVVSLVASIVIVHKAGYSGFWALLTLVPFVSVIAYVVLASLDWPVHQELRALREAEGEPEPLR